MISSQRWPLGVAPLTALDATVEEYVSAAATAGFDVIGVRPYPVVDTDPEFPTVGTQRFKDLKLRIDDSGLKVLDVEVFSVRPATGRDDWLPVIEAGYELGAKYMNIVGDNPDLEALESVVAEITEDAAKADVVPVLEPVAYRPLNDFALAIEMAYRVGCKVELDVLHFMRTGATLDLIAEHKDMFPILQLCDAPRDINSIRYELLPYAATASDLDLQVAESRSMRQLAGEGEAPIREMLELVGDSLAGVSVEIPNARVRADLNVADYFSLLTKQSLDFLSTQATLG